MRDEHSAAEFGQALHSFLPSGPIWPRSPTTNQAQVVYSMALGTVRNRDAANALLIDSFPATAFYLLPEWEASVGLPDRCSPLATSLQARQHQVAAKLAARGGQSVEYFTAVAASYGIDITIEQYAPSRFGMGFGDDFGGNEWAHAWTVHVPATQLQYFMFGTNNFGEDFSTWGISTLECVLNGIAPAHTVLLFSYAAA